MRKDTFLQVIEKIARICLQRLSLFYMNFLSHYYFDLHADSPYRVVGALLPDLLKNANKDWNLYPQKSKHLFENNQVYSEILEGWKKHLSVDKIFHSHSFFFEHTKAIKQQIAHLMEQSPIRPSFYSHIALELLLDHLLTQKYSNIVDDLYSRLDLVSTKEIDGFLKLSGVTQTAIFDSFFNSFKSSRYLSCYTEMENIAYALNRICLRVWPTGLNQDTIKLTTLQLSTYKLVLEEDFMRIFDEIETRLQLA